MGKNKEGRTRAKIEYIDFKEYAMLLIRKRHGDMFFEASLTEMLENLKFKKREELHFDPIKGIRKFATNTLSKIKGKNAVQQQEPKKEQDKELEL